MWEDLHETRQDIDFFNMDEYRHLSMIEKDMKDADGSHWLIVKKEKAMLEDYGGVFVSMEEVSIPEEEEETDEEDARPHWGLFDPWNKRLDLANRI